jgi:adenylate cyclase
MSFFNELKRRNVIRVAVAYMIVGWLIMQAGEVMGPALHLPEWVNSALAFFLILGFPLAMIFAWAFEMTADGIKKEKDVDRSQSITPGTGKKLNFTIIALLALSLGYFVWESRFQTDEMVETKFTAELTSQESLTQAEPSLPAVTPIQPTADDKSIAVLPFINMSDDASNEYFSDGITEEVLNLLAKIPELKVTSRSSVFSFKGQNPDIPTVAKKLNVAHILEGSVRKANNRVRITAQLIKADSDVHLWSETYDRELNDIFAIQDEIALAVVNALKVTLLGDAPAAAVVDPDAYAYFLQGRYLYAQRSEENSFKSEKAYEAALEIDPEYASAWAGLSMTVVRLAGFGFIEYESGVTKALDAARRAVELDPGLALAWVSLAGVQSDYLWQWEAANQSTQKALELDPSNSDVLFQANANAATLGQLDLALKYIEKAVELDPLNLRAINVLASSYALTGRSREAEKQHLHLLDLNPDYASGHVQYAYTLLKLGRFNEAVVEANKESGEIWPTLLRAMAFYSLDKKKAADAELGIFIEKNHEFWAYQIAEIYSWRDQADEAFTWLETAHKNRDPGLGNVLYDSSFDNIHSDPRWETFLEKMGLLQAWRAMPEKYKGIGQ